MFKLYFLIYLLAHILGDYYFQSEVLASQKKERIRKLIRHCIFYLAAFLVVILPVFTYEMLISVLIISLTHAAIDILKYCYMKYWKKHPNSIYAERKMYLIDQAVHLLTLAIAAYIMARNGYQFNLVPVAEEFYRITGFELLGNISWIVLVLIIYKPANITIKRMLSMYKPEDKIEEKNGDNDNKAGGFIGFLERIIILFFLLIGQYAAIGLVLTAKSVARYDKISKDKKFAEYYLLGTLLSTVIVIAAYSIIL
ncbi:MAG: DUF3307 domain-containing protein [Mobilitalea sp.]